jgi:CDGSH-type Zn-finger protein
MKPNERKDLTEITIISHGPIKVSGDFIITGTDQRIIETESNIFLCRCGGSENKPFCDGTHRKIGVRD